MDRGYKTTQRQLILAAVCLIAVAALPLVPSARAADQEQSKGITIYGQSELPKVLYIVPWKRRQPGEIDMPSSKSLASDVLETIDPQIFRRQILYYDLMTGEQGGKKN
jgi:hypothetical protein